MGLRWQMPEDRPLVPDPEDEAALAQSPEVAAAYESEQENLQDIIDWIKSDDKQVTKVSCVMAENIVRGLIHGDRYLYCLGETPPAWQGMPELEYLQECNINCYAVKGQQRSKGVDIAVTVKGTPDYFYVGHDEEELTRAPRTVGPRQSGPPADIHLFVGADWVMEMTPKQREAHIFNALATIRPHEHRYMNPWQVVAHDMNGINSFIIQYYGTDITDSAQQVTHAVMSNVQMVLPSMSDNRKDAVLEILARERGIELTKNGKPVNADGTEKADGDQYTN